MQKRIAEVAIMPSRIWKGAPRPAEWTGKPPSPEMVRALEALKAGSMEPFRVGYAHDFRGPFFHKGTIEGLWKRGLVDYSAVVKCAFITRAGLSWLAANKQTNAEAA
jgi:hypothetical protein